MNSTRSSCYQLVIAVATTVVSAFALAGCAVDTSQDSEDVGAAAEAIGQATCATTAANATINQIGSFTSPRTYDNAQCGKAEIVDVTNLNVNFNGGVAVSWADTLPTNQTDCQNAFLQVYVYNETGASPPPLSNILRAQGTWGSFFGGPPTCTGPSISVNLIDGRNYRFAVTARTEGTSAAPTRKVRVATFDGIQ